MNKIIFLSLVCLLGGSFASAQAIDVSRGADPSVDYAGLDRFGPWDDRNYQLTRTDVALLSDNEHELRVAIPAFYRVQLRRSFPGMLREGPLQYPHSAALAFMHEHDGLQIDGKYYAKALPENGRWRVVTDEPFAVLSDDGVVRSLEGDVQISSPAGARESAIDISPVNPQLAVAGTVLWPNPVRQDMFFSTDGGSSWAASEPLPLGGALGDPTVAYSSDGGFVYTASLQPSLTTLYFYRSADNGQTWTDLANEPGGDPRREVGVNGADKEILHVDESPTSPFQDNIYMTWDNFNQGNTMKFARSTDFGHTWSPVMSLNAPAGIAGDIATDAAGKLYYIYPAFSNRTIQVVISNDGGTSFGPAQTIASTAGEFQIFVPSQATRGALIYTSADTDRSNGPFAGSVYAAWGDSPTAAEGSSYVRVGYSRDGGSTWTLVSPQPPSASVDRYHPWLEVDENGNVHVIYYDTQDDPSRGSVHLYHSVSADGGQTWTSSRLTTQSSPGANDGFDFGDYNGMSISMNQLLASYSDNRDFVVDTYAAGTVLGGGGPVYTLLDTNPGTAGVVNEWSTQNGTANAGNVVYFGFGAGSTSVNIGPCTGVSLGMNNARPIAFASADAAGSATASRNVPSAASGLTVTFQALDLGNCSTTNTISTTF